MVAPHGAGMLPLYVGDLPGRQLQTVFLLYLCVDFLIGREAADLDIIGRLVVHVDEFSTPLTVNADLKM